jgi:hypothetical protein
MLVRDKTLVVSPALMDPLFAGLDRLRAMLDDIQASDGVPIQQEVARLKAILEGGGAEGGTVEASVQGGTGRRFNLDSDAVRSVLKRGMILYHAKAYLHRDVDAKWKSPLAFLSGALSVGQCLDAFLDVSDIGGLEDETEADLCVTLLFASVLEPDLLLVGLKLPESQIETLDMTALKASLLPKPAAAPASTAPPEKRAAKPPAIETAGLEEGLPEAGSPEAVQSKASKEAGADTLRVKVGLLSKLMNLTGELVLGRNQLLRTMRSPSQGLRRSCRTSTRSPPSCRKRRFRPACSPSAGCSAGSRASSATWPRPWASRSTWRSRAPRWSWTSRS